MIRWDEIGLPAGPAAVLRSLQQRRPFALPDSTWLEALAFADRFQLTLLLRGEMPDWVVERIAHDRERNRERNRRLLETFHEIDRALAGQGLLVLKGFANWDLFPVTPDDRVQYDLDLYCPDNLPEVRDVLLGMGYEAVEGPLTLVRRSNWKWNGDFYDPEIPISIDLHERLWDESMEGFAIAGLVEFWQRRVWRTVAGMRFQALAPPDALAFAAIHMLRHLLHGDARPVQVYEIAGFLEARSTDDGFWPAWRDLHPPELRRIEAIAFRLAEEWFGCAVHEIVQAEMMALPPKVRRWFERFAASPIVAFFHPNKNELELNLSLLDGVVPKARVMRRRLLPARWPRPFSYAVRRGIFHLRAFAPTLSMMLRIRR